MPESTEPRASIPLRLVLSAAVAAASLTPSPARAAPEIPKAAEERYSQGVRERDAGRYTSAAAEFAEAYAQIPVELKDLRASVLFDLVDAQRGAFNQTAGRVRDREHPAAYLCAADRALQEFIDAEKGARKGKKSPDLPKAAELHREVQAQLKTVRAETPDFDCATAVVPSDAADAPAPDPSPAEPTPPPPRRAIDRPLVIAGGVLAGVGVIMVGVMAGGLVRGKRAEADGDALVDANPTLPRDDPALQEIDQRGKVGNRMAIAGGVLGAVALGTGVALLVLGLRGRPSRVAAAPYLGPRAGGLTLRWQF
jgi:hypothetical protein